MMDAEEISEWYHNTKFEMTKMEIKHQIDIPRYALLLERAKVLKAVMENGTRHD